MGTRKGDVLGLGFRHGEWGGERARKKKVLVLGKGKGWVNDGWVVMVGFGWGEICFFFFLNFFKMKYYNYRIFRIIGKF